MHQKRLGTTAISKADIVDKEPPNKTCPSLFGSVMTKIESMPRLSKLRQIGANAVYPFSIYVHSIRRKEQL